MASEFLDEARLELYRRFAFEFPDRTLSGKVVLIAGATGGLGAATAALLAGEGARVVAGYRSNRSRAEEFRRAIAGQFQQTIELVEGDLIHAAVRERYVLAAEKWGPLYGLAVLVGDPARVEWSRLDEAAMRAAADRNYIAPVLLAKRAGEAMLAQKTPGSIVLLSTMQAVAPFDGSVNYAGPKAALVQAARILAKQWGGPAGIRVNVVAPGVTMAGMAEASIRAGKYDSFIKGGAIARFGRAEDVARAIRFLLEPDNYITGQTILVDGGLTLRRDRG